MASGVEQLVGIAWTLMDNSDVHIKVVQPYFRVSLFHFQADTCLYAEWEYVHFGWVHCNTIIQAEVRSLKAGLPHWALTRKLHGACESEAYLVCLVHHWQAKHDSLLWHAPATPCHLERMLVNRILDPYNQSDNNKHFTFKVNINVL